MTQTSRNIDFSEIQQHTKDSVKQQVVDGFLGITEAAIEGAVEGYQEVSKSMTLNRLDVGKYPASNLRVQRRLRQNRLQEAMQSLPQLEKPSL